VTGAFALSTIPSRTRIEDKFSLPTVAESFCSLYPNRVQAIVRPKDCRSWTTLSKHWPLSDETILNAIDGKESGIWGARWGEQTQFAVLDIDKDSKYRSDLVELANLQEKLAAVGLTATPYRSSESGGWHLYLFFDDWAPTNEVNQTLATWLRAIGYEIRNGVLEIYPSGMGLRLPLQAGFAWLDGKGEVIRQREQLTKDEALASFLFDLEENKRDWSEAKNRIQAQLEAIDREKKQDALAHRKAIDTEGFDKLFNYRLIPEKYEEGRKYWQTGLTASGQRHDAILAVEHYLWHGDEAAGVPALPAEHNDEPRYRLILAWLEEHHNGFCNHINRGKWHKVQAQIKRAVKWRRPSGAVQERIPYPMTERLMERLIALYKATGRVWSVEDLKKGNDGREEGARKKIREALQLLTDQGRRLTGRQLMRLTGCSYHTVKRHSDIWKISPVVALPRAAGDKNPFLDLLPPCPPALGAAGSEKSFLNPPGSGDSGDLEVDRDLSVQERGAPSEDLEQAASLCSAVASPIPPQAAATLRFGAASAEQPCELAPIDLGCLLSRAFRQVAKARESDGKETAGSLASPPHTQPSTGSKHWLLRVSGTCGLNGFLPGSAEPPLGPPHLNPRELFSKGSGLVMLQEGGSSQAEAHSGVYSSQVPPFGIFRYRISHFHSGVNPSARDALQSGRYGNDQRRNRCIRVNSPFDCGLRVLVYSDVRGPPIWIAAQTASFENDDTAFGASCLELCSTNRCHRVACLRKMQHGHVR
jgi:hypothetical protein